MEKKKLYIIAIICVLFFSLEAKFLDMKETSYAPRYPNNIVSTSANITPEELRAFLKTWIKYCEEYEQCMHLPNISYDTKDISNQMDKSLKKWLENYGWDVNRFVYIDSRLRVIMSTIRRDEDILKKQQLMKEGAQNSTNKIVAETLRREAFFQNKSLNIEKITNEERNMVAPQQEEILKLLNGEYN